MLIEGVGIDLGNANTRVAIYRNGGIVIIPDVDGGDSFPSVVAFDSHNQTRLTGSKARSPSSSPSLRVVGNIKRRIRERPYGLANSETLTDHNREREIVSSIEGLAAIFDRVMVNLAVYYKSSLEPLTIRAVINVPALFNEHQRQVIRDAAKVVGIDVLSLIATPNAICYAWALNGGHINTGTY
jgi:molecular chaperone DnaK